MILRPVWVALAIGLAPFLSPIAAADEGLSVGVARVDITPEGPVWLSGYLARSTESKGVDQRIWAKALAVGSDEQGPAVLVSVDSLGVSAAIVAEVAARLEKKTALRPERFSVAASHTHYAPCLTGVAPHIFGRTLPDDEQARIAAYTRTFVDRLEQVALAALADRQPGRLAWTQGTVGFAANRRTKGGPVDHALPVLRVTGLDGKIRAILTNYACHCTTIGPADNLIHGDWAGAAQVAIEAEHPGCVALTVVGCGADSNPAPRGTAAMAIAHGRLVANEVNRLLSGAWTDLPTTPPTIEVEKLALPFDTLPDREALDKLVKAGGPPGYNASVWLARLDRGEKLPETLPYSAQAWRFGDKLAMVFLPGEVVVDYVLRLKKELDPSRLWVSAYSNDAPCYIPSERILREGGYEAGGAMVYYGWPTRLKPGVEDRIDSAVLRVVGPGFEAPKIAEPPKPPLTPEQGQAAWRVRPGLKVELVAAEPLVESPVAIDFGADGKLWVCEMRDYPMGIANDWKPGGVVKVLEDRDNDGRYETATKFLDGLPFPTGVMAWRKGVLVCAAPEVFYAEDTDGDGKADLRKPLLQGFATENYQARVNGLSYGLDNWVYGANGLIGGTIRGMAGGTEINIGGRDFRMKPDTGVFEPASGLTQQGRVRDDWGNPFGGNNSVLLLHYPLPDHYARRNPRVAPPAPAVTVVQDADPARVYPASETVARFNHPESADRVTSACSPLIYRDTYLGAEYRGNAFTCEPVHNLVRRAVLEPSGATFTGHRALGEETSEFLASTDPWSRPVQVRTGPDGALWVVDMYRAVVEHPRWIAPETLKNLDVRAGATMGRIYRVVADGYPTRPVARLESLSGAELAAAINTPNGTVRDNVQRLLVHRGDRSAAPALAELARTSPHPEARVQALGTLDGLGVLEPATLTGALSDSHPGVRREAVRLAEARFATAPDLLTQVAKLADDADPAVRFQVALALGESTNPTAGAALARIAVRDGADPWTRAAVLSSASPHAATVLGSLIAGAGPDGPTPGLVEPLLATIAGSNNPVVVALALESLRLNEGDEPQAWRLAALAGLIDTVKFARLSIDPGVAPTLVRSRDWATDRSRPVAVRVAALRLLGRGDPDTDRATLADRLDPSEPTEIQTEGIRGLVRLGDRPSADAVIAAWTRLGPTVRSGALDALLARPATTEAVVAGLEQGRIAPTLIDAAHREQMMGKGTADHRDRVAKVFGPAAIGPRRAVITAYAPAKTLTGNRDRGAKVFARACATCHRVGTVGHEVGPDLAALTDTSPDALLGAILDPNAEVDARYASYTAALKDGRVLSGLIASETAGAITLKRQDGAADAILRVDLDDLATSGRSLMPEGLENDLTHADMADLLTFLDRGTIPPKVLAGNQPRTIAADAGGTLRLTADSAAIYGPTLTFESEHANLGYWNSAQDRAVWTVHLDQPATFSASLEWSCAEDSDGTAFDIRAGASMLRGKVASTGGWSDYRTLWVGEIALTAGDHRVEMRPTSPIVVALADVRGLTLIPKGKGSLPPAIPVLVAEPTSVEDRARQILDPATPSARREALLDVPPSATAPMLSALTQGLDPADHAEESRRIPWLWRVAIAAGRRNESAEIIRILDVALPADNQPLTRWQAVAVGGGIINGITLAGAWPGERVETLLRDDPTRLARWHRALRLASAMADDPEVPPGTRYDALRMVGLESWDRAGDQLVRYLAPSTNGELQQGAVCALGDLPDPRATRALLDGLAGLTSGNRKWALEALVRDDDRRSALLDAVEAGRIQSADLPVSLSQLLMDPARNRSHDRARALLAR